MPDIFDLLHTDHRKVESLLRDLASAFDGDRRRSLAEELVMAESRHEAAEEMVFWPAVRSSAEGGDALADEGINQEDEGKELLARLDKASPGDAEFVELVSKFTEAAREHITFEEQHVWPALRAALSPSDCDELGDKFQHAEESGPTRPHPHGPSTEGGLKSVGAAAAATDKVRDAVTGRGRE